MLIQIKTLEGFQLHAEDGVLGKITDLYFDDHTWSVRYLVVAAGSWLAGRHVLIAPAALRTVELDRGEVSVALTQAQVKTSPVADTALPVSRQYESELNRHFGWSAYSVGGAGTGQVPPAAAMGVMGVLPARELAPQPLTASAVPKAADVPISDDPSIQANAHLRSAEAVRGYYLEATDEPIGHIEDLIVESADWSVRYLYVGTKNWWPGKKVVVPVRHLRELNWPEKKGWLDLSRDAVKSAPSLDDAAAFTTEYAGRLNRHYAGVIH
jgi:uncharacterized protein YrrD